MRSTIIAALCAAASAAGAQQADPDVIWRGDFEEGSSSLTGHCSAGQDQWCLPNVIRPQQITVVQDPVAQGRYAARFEIRYGDTYKDYSDTRSLMSGPTTLWEVEGNERWYRWQVLWPGTWKGRFPKWDQLGDSTAFSDGGSIVEWHHDNNGARETGSAPLYIKADDKDIMLCLVDHATNTCRLNKRLVPLQRGHWHDFILHAKWSSSSDGLLEVWIDGQQVLPTTAGSNMFPGMRNYLVIGLYRNGHIGDPNLRAPDGSLVYGSDPVVQVAYVDGFVIGKTEASVKNGLQWGPSPASSPSVAGASMGGPTGCSTSGAGIGWLALALLAISRRGPRTFAPAVRRNARGVRLPR